MQVLAYSIIGIGVVFVLIGIIGIYRFNNFYARLLSAADIDTVGLITILLGVAILSGFNLFTLKVVLILMLILIINPIVTSAIASSAYFSGYKLKEDDDVGR